MAPTGLGGAEDVGYLDSGAQKPVEDVGYLDNAPAPAPKQESYGFDSTYENSDEILEAE